jgi:hypothetical protein
MKKLSILLIGLLLITGFAVAQEFDGGVEISGSASVTWGVDLNSNATGFVNAGTSSVTITLVAEQDVSASGDDDLYGEITIAELSLTADATDGAFTLGGDSGTITAKIVVSPVEIIIYAGPDMEWGNAESPDDGDVVSVNFADNVAITNAPAGITIVLPVDPASISVYFVSDGDWLAATENTNNDYAIGTDVEVVVDIITVDLGGYYGWFNASGSWGATAALAVALDVLNGVDVSIGADIVDTSYEVEFGTTVNLTEANADDDMGNVGVIVSYDSNDNLDAQLTVTEPTAGGFVDMVGATVVAQLFDLTSGAIVWNIDVTGEYSDGGLRPYFGFGYGSDTIFDLNAGVELGADFTGIDNTTVTLDYISTQLSPAPVDNGIITAMVEVAY